MRVAYHFLSLDISIIGRCPIYTSGRSLSVAGYRSRRFRLSIQRPGALSTAAVTPRKKGAQPVQDAASLRVCDECPSESFSVGWRASTASARSFSALRYRVLFTKALVAIIEDGAELAGIAGEDSEALNILPCRSKMVISNRIRREWLQNRPERPIMIIMK